jgi:hypothetical protein
MAPVNKGGDGQRRIETIRLKVVRQKRAPERRPLCVGRLRSGRRA